MSKVTELMGDEGRIRWKFYSASTLLVTKLHHHHRHKCLKRLIIFTGFVE